jgi:hypothetical protein
MTGCYKGADMGQIGGLTTQKVVKLLSSDSGMPASVAELAASEGASVGIFSANQVIPQNVAPEIAERSTGAKYPLIHVYCSKLSNLLKEKFRTFSGTAQMAVEVRVSQDRLEGLELVVQLYADAVAEVLDQSRGDWGDGVFFCGGYEINYGPVKSGGKNFIQIAKVTFVLDVSS